MQFSESIQKKLVPFIVSLAMFMEAIDSTVINTAIPSMATSLHVNPVDLKIALISYLLSLAIFIPISGWIADKFGIKRVFMAAIALFTISSIWCGFSHTLLELVIARAIQGLGGSLTLPVGRLILLRTFPRSQMIIMMGRVVMVASLGLMLGPALGGVITHYFSWHWIFWINIPVGIIGVVLAGWCLADILPQTVPALDKLGFILFGTGLAGLTFGLSAFSESTISNPVAMIIIGAAIALLGCYFWHSRSQKYPIVNTQLFSVRTFQVSCLGNLLARLGFGGVPFLLPLVLQIGLGYSAQISGMLMVPTALGVLLVKPFALRLLKFLGYRRLLIINTFLVALSLWSFISINKFTSIYFIVLLTFIYGFLISLQYTCMNSLAYAETPAENLSSAASFVGTLQQLAQSFGVATCAILLRAFKPAQAITFVLTIPVFHEVFFTIGVITLLSIIVFIRLTPEDGSQMIQ